MRSEGHSRHKNVEPRERPTAIVRHTAKHRRVPTAFFGLLRPESVVVIDEDRDEVIEMPLPEHDEVVEQFLPQRLVEPLHERYGVGRSAGPWPNFIARAT